MRASREGLSQPLTLTLTIYSKHYLCIKKNSTPLGTLTQAPPSLVLTCVCLSVSPGVICVSYNPRVTNTM